MPFRLLARAAPFLLGAIAAAIWLHRRRQRELRVPPPAALPAGRAVELAVPAVRPPTGRFVRVADRRPVDIVTIVDDLLATAR